MKLLALDASTAICSVAVEADGQIVQQTREVSRSHSQFILPMIDSCLHELNVQIKDLDAIAFGKGPGSFTGLRLTASIVQAIAYSHDLPVVPVSSLQAIAQAVYQQEGVTDLVVCEDARIQQVYWCHFKLSDGFMQPVTVETCEAMDGVANYLKTFEKAPVLIQDAALPLGSSLLTLAHDYLAKQQTVTPELALPSYVQALQYKRSGIQ